MRGKGGKESIGKFGKPKGHKLNQQSEYGRLQGLGR